MSKGITRKMRSDIFRKHSTERFRTARRVFQQSSRNNGVHEIKAELTIYKNQKAGYNQTNDTESIRDSTKTRF